MIFKRFGYTCSVRVNGTQFCGRGAGTFFARLAGVGVVVSVRAPREAVPAFGRASGVAVGLAHAGVDDVPERVDWRGTMRTGLALHILIS